MENKKDQAIIGALSLAFDKNYGNEGLFEYHIRDFINILYYHNVREEDSVRYYLTKAIGNEGENNKLITETISVFMENELEAGMEAYDDDYRDEDHDGYFEKQYYQNPSGKCEDAPCCGCCGMM